MYCSDYTRECSFRSRPVVIVGWTVQVLTLPFFPQMQMWLDKTEGPEDIDEVWNHNIIDASLSEPHRTYAKLLTRKIFLVTIIITSVAKFALLPKI